MPTTLQLAIACLPDLQEEYLSQMRTHLLSPTRNQELGLSHLRAQRRTHKTVSLSKTIRNREQAVAKPRETVIPGKEGVETNRRHIGSFLVHNRDASKEEAANHTVLRSIIPEVPAGASQLRPINALENRMAQIIYHLR